MIPATVSSFGIGFVEEFLLLLVSGVFLGACVHYALRFAGRWMRGRAGILGASGPLFLFAALFFFINVPRIRAAVSGGMRYFLAMALVTAVVLAWGVRRRGFLTRGIAGGVFLLTAASLLAFSIFQFITAHHTPFHGETLVALVDVEETTLPPDFDASTHDVTLVYKRSVHAIRMNLHYLEEGRPSPPLAFLLPGEKWGVGGSILQVHNWLFLLGGRTFYRLTSVDAKFRDNEIPHYGRNLPGYHPDEDDTGARLNEKIPLLHRKLGEICRVETRKTVYEDVVYEPVSAGRYWGIYIRQGGAFVPRSLPPERYHALRKGFVEPAEPIL